MAVVNNDFMKYAEPEYQRLVLNDWLEHASSVDQELLKQVGNAPIEWIKEMYPEVYFYGPNIEEVKERIERFKQVTFDSFQDIDDMLTHNMVSASAQAHLPTRKAVTKFMSAADKMDRLMEHDDGGWGFQSLRVPYLGDNSPSGIKIPVPSSVTPLTMKVVLTALTALQLRDLIGHMYSVVNVNGKPSPTQVQQQMFTQDDYDSAVYWAQRFFFPMHREDKDVEEI